MDALQAEQKINELEGRIEALEVEVQELQKKASLSIEKIANQLSVSLAKNKRFRTPCSI